MDRGAWWATVHEVTKSWAQKNSKPNQLIVRYAAKMLWLQFMLFYLLLHGKLIHHLLPNNPRADFRLKEKKSRDTMSSG